MLADDQGQIKTRGHGDVLRGCMVCDHKRPVWVLGGILALRISILAISTMVGNITVKQTKARIMKEVNWGILSTAKIGREKVIPAMQKGQWSQIGAIASRSLEQAQKVADAMGIAKAYGSYDELFADPDIEAIYNPLPNNQHVAMTLAAARAGKHVLCEKPFAMNVREAEELREVAGKVHIMEAFMVRFHPQWLRARAGAQRRPG